MKQMKQKIHYFWICTAFIGFLFTAYCVSVSLKSYQSTLLFLQKHPDTSLSILEKTEWKSKSATSYLHYLLTKQSSSLSKAAAIKPNHYWYLDLLISQESIEHFPKTIHTNSSAALALFLSDKALEESRLNTQESMYKALFLVNTAQGLYPYEDIYYTYGEILRNSYHSYQHAEQMYLHALAQNPTNQTYWRSYGYCLNSMNNSFGALSCYVIQERLSPTSSSPKISIAKSLQQMGYIEEAVHTLQLWSIENPDIIDYYFALGSVYSANKDYYNAQEQYQKAVEVFPHEATAYYELGNFFYSQKEYRKALLQHTKAIGMMTIQNKQVSAWWWYRKGLDYYQLKDFEGAIKSFQQALHISESSSFYYWLGRSYDGNEDYINAIRYYDLYLETNPTNESVQRWRMNCMKKAASS
jgi:tetratricopeptide (TPR) repeat protein